MTSYGNQDGSRGVLGWWIEQTEGAKFWLKVFTELGTRGVQDVLTALVDGLTGMVNAIGTAFLQTTWEVASARFRCAAATLITA